ncbi:MAG: HAD family hydrolase [Chloroflexi bacterium]|nr:HAD family hydrolase [Chloroflexota bacterium]
MRLLPVQGNLPVERGHLTVTHGQIEAITFDFGNTLVPVDRAALRRVVELTGDAVCIRAPELDRGAFLDAWAEERERQFREEVPQFREVDLEQRLVRVFARIRGGMAPPPPDERWDQDRAALHSDAAEVAAAVEAYSRAFVAGLPPAPGVGAMLGRLAASWRLAILSNWPLAATVDHYAAAQGWLPHLRAVVVSQRVGTIKPHPAMFAAARKALGSPPGERILHVGDDWAADMAGAAGAGWQTAWLKVRPLDSPLPSSESDGSVEPDFILDTVTDLEAALGR